MGRQIKRRDGTSVGPRIREIRLILDLSMREVNKSIGLSHPGIYNYEHGLSHVTIGRLQQIANAFGCQMADLLKPVGSPFHRRTRRRRKGPAASRTWRDDQAAEGATRHQPAGGLNALRPHAAM